VIYSHGQTVAFRQEGRLLEGKFIGSIRLLNGKMVHGVDVKGEVYFFTSPLLYAKDLKQAGRPGTLHPTGQRFSSATTPTASCFTRGP
jgi:hypothetical protein